MSKQFIEIGAHGYYGDFYRSNHDDIAFRADNLEIATKIAFNNWLYNFDRLYRSCRLISIDPGKFTVEIYSHSRKSGASIGSQTKTYTVQYHGPADMYEAPVIQDNCDNPEFQQILIRMQQMADDGHPAVRISNRSGRVIFSNIGFPRYHADGKWWSSENTYLDTNPVYATEQMEYALADDSERDIIRVRNFNVHMNKIRSTPEAE